MQLTDFIKFFENTNNIKLLPQQVQMLELLEDGKNPKVIMRPARKAGVTTAWRVWNAYQDHIKKLIDEAEAKKIISGETPAVDLTGKEKWEK